MVGNRKGFVHQNTVGNRDDDVHAEVELSLEGESLESANVICVDHNLVHVDSFDVHRKVHVVDQDGEAEVGILQGDVSSKSGGATNWVEAQVECHKSAENLVRRCYGDVGDCLKFEMDVHRDTSISCDNSRQKSAEGISGHSC